MRVRADAQDAEWLAQFAYVDRESAVREEAHPTVLHRTEPFAVTFKNERRRVVRYANERSANSCPRLGEMRSQQSREGDLLVGEKSVQRFAVRSRPHLPRKAGSWRCRQPHHDPL